MFSSSPQDFPLRSRLWGIALGSLILVAATAVVVSAKTIQASLPALLIAALAAAVARRQLKYAKLHLDGVTLSLLAFIFYAGLSALWAPKPQATALIALMAALIALLAAWHSFSSCNQSATRMRCTWVRGCGSV